MKAIIASISLLLAFSVLLCHCKSPTRPKWESSYTVNGAIKLPYAEIEEPYFAYFDNAKNRSRIDYYGDMVQTYQLQGDNSKNYGTMKKVAYMTTEKVLNKKRCFQTNGTKDAPVSKQSVLPDMSKYTFIKVDQAEGGGANVWQMTEVIGSKKNSYTMWVSSDNQKPIKYEMMGYDTLMGSHYDRYYVTYHNFTEQNITDEMFKLPKGVSECSGFPGPGDKEHQITMNPMKEYINHDDSHISDMFDKFKRTHNKKYIDGKDHSERLIFFKNNVRFIHSKNRAGLGYSLKVNHLADYNNLELESMRGYRHSGEPSNAKVFNINDFDVRDVPDNLDWRLYGAVTPVKDQAVCGSCWSFGTAEHVEGAYFLKTGTLKRLSQQELMDCSWGEGNNACDGGEDFRAYEWIKKHGLATEEAYGPYLGQDGMCISANVTATAFISGYVNVTPMDIQALKVAISNQGPISVAIDAAHKEFSFYSNGVYYNPECGNKPDDLDHAVLAVGFGYMNGQGYWLVKNSWSTYWGNDGYVLMASKDNNCGVATAATYVIMK